MKHIYLNTNSGMIQTRDHISDDDYSLLYIGQGEPKLIINWLITLQGSMGDFMDTDIETLRKSWERHSL